MDQPAHHDARQFLPLPTPTLHILVAFRGGQRHGYAVMQEVERLSDGLVRIGPGTLYAAIKRLLADGLVVEVDQDTPADGEQRRRYYRLTALGEQVCDAELARLATLVRRAAQRPPGTLRFGEA
jgi:DNA-binding PadR family transcriptional regulator